MKTKLIAARVAMRAGCAMAIAEGAVERPIRALERGAAATWFEPAGDPHAARKRWISGMKPRGRVTVDAGAVAALGRGKSLLPAGVTAAHGDFHAGDPVELVDPDGAVIARGLVAYSADEVPDLLGRSTSDLRADLGKGYDRELVHRDDLVLLG